MANKSQEEFECKYIKINVAELTERLNSLGAVKKFDRIFRRYVFDYPDLRLNDDNSWLRVRDEGDKTTLTFKQRMGVSSHKNDDGMKEIEVEVGDFDDTVGILRAIGMKPKFYEENRRIMYDLHGVEVSIDTWPLLDTYVEIEGNSWDDVDNTALKLGFKLEDKRICATYQLYEEEGVNENDYSVLTFEQQLKK